MTASRDKDVHKAGIADWRALRATDIPEVVRIAAVLHPDFPERREVLEEKLRLFPAGCFALEKDTSLYGYALAHPWTPDDIPRLDAFLEKLPPSPTCLHLHDVAIMGPARGVGAAAAVEQVLSDVARERRLGTIALVSLYGTDRLWSRMGYRPRENAGLAEKLKDYGAGAVYMAKEL
ncbi:MAG: GNAT family N-acetyltransferase [Methylocystis sp.]|uniref:GNAT family N-acetyltransferase n=1 Tax=Methylocystis sp. TaxID=1911079 RepID=UPI003DA3C313